MARQKPSDGDRHSVDELTDEAQRLATDNGVSYDSVLSCLKRYSEVLAAGSDDAIPDAVELTRSAFGALEGQHALDFLEKADPRELKRRSNTFSFLALGNQLPVYTLGELRTRIKRFAIYCNESRDYLVRTGLPPQQFRGSPWLYVQLGRLYDTRVAGFPFPRRNASKRDIEPYRWMRVPDGHHTPGDCKHCSYHEASLLRGMDPADAERLEAERARFFAARMSVLEELQQPCQRSDGDGLLKRCLEILDQQLTRETMLFLLRMDAWYLDRDVRNRDHLETDCEWAPGGLTNLLEVVGHVVVETHIGQFDQLVRALPNEIRRAIVRGGLESNYCLSVVSRSDRCILDAAFDEFERQVEATGSRWGDYTLKLTCWLDPDHRTNVSFAMLSKYRSKIQPIVDGFLRDLESRADQGQPLVTVPTAPSDSKTRSTHRCEEELPPQKNAFRFNKGSWTIIFKNVTVACPHMDGFFYIAKLLEQPNVEVDPLDLRRRLTAWAAPSSSPSSRQRGQMELADDFSEGFSKGLPSLGVAFDDESLGNYRTVLERLKGEIEVARSNGLGDQALELQEQFEELQRYIDQNINRRGQPKALSSTRKNASDAVRNAIQRALSKLEKNHSDLHQHFLDHLEYGTCCRYKNPSRIEWGT